MIQALGRHQLEHIGAVVLYLRKNALEACYESRVT